jgi:hypothetical protein
LRFEVVSDDEPVPLDHDTPVDEKFFESAGQPVPCAGVSYRDGHGALAMSP